LRLILTSIKQDTDGQGQDWECCVTPKYQFILREGYAKMIKWVMMNGAGAWTVTRRGVIGEKRNENAALDTWESC